MKNQDADSKKIIINYGLIAGGIAILIALISYAMGIAANPGVVISIISFVLPFALIVLGIKKFKEKNNGFLTWGEAVKTGIGIALIWGVLTLSFQLFLENVIAPEIFEQKLEITREALENWGIDDDAIDEQIEKQRNASPIFGFAMGILLFAFLGFIVSAIAGAVMKKTEEDQY